MQQGLLQPRDDCQAKSSQELLGASQRADGGWRLECIKSHHAHVSRKWATSFTFLVSDLGSGDKEVDHCSAVQSLLSR